VFVVVLNTMVSLQVVKEDDESVSVEVSIDRLKSSEYFDGLMVFCNGNSSLPFPPQYHDVFDIYCNFVTCDIICNTITINITNTPITRYQHVITSQQLGRSFELCHYLVDQLFFTYLINYLLENWTAHHDIINSLSLALSMVLHSR